MSLTKEEVQHIATLCRIALSSEELSWLGSQLSHILEQFRILEELDTGDVHPISHAVYAEGVMREDMIVPSLSKELILSNAPQQLDDQFKVNKVLED